MTVLDIEEVLRTFSILIDKREQETDRARKRHESFKVPYNKATLDFGDYTYQSCINNKNMHDIENRVIPSYAIERKMSLDELAGCFTHDRKRFIAEFERARAVGARIDLIVENATWENLLNGKYRSKMNPKAFEASIIAFRARYDMGIFFCKEETTGELIKELLYRDLKERLQRGEFDGREERGVCQDISKH